MEQEISKFLNLLGNWVCVNSVYQALFSPPMHESLGTRLAGYGTKTTVIRMSLSEPHTSELNGGIFIYYIYIICRTSFRKCKLTLLTL